jgi:anaerobic magnesium-protoporphyrin IX monomethyl ester cyclase
MSSILLIFPKSDQPIFASSKGKGVLTRPLGFFPPLGILYIGRSLLDAGFEVEAVDFNSTLYNNENLKRLLSGKDAVGITTDSFNRKNVNILINDIRKVNPDIKIITGGPDVTLHQRSIEGSDLSIAGETEKIAPEIFETLINNGNFKKLYGSIYRKHKSNRTIFGKEPYCESDLDSIKFPARELLRTEEKSKGYNFLGEKNKTKIATMIATRGCPFHCRFCAHNAVTFKRFRRRSVENCLDEIEKITSEGYTILGIVDDNFLSIVNKELVTGILKGIIDRRYKLITLVQGRVDSARDPGLYKLMRRAGVIAVVYGMESMNQDVLNFYRKGTTVELNRKAAYLTYKYGIFSMADFIIGTPFEDEKLIKKMIKDVYSMRLDAATFWTLEYTYGAPLWDEAKERGLINGRTHTVPAGREHNLSPLTSTELDNLSYKAFRSFYSRPIYWLRLFQKILRFDKRTLYLLLRLIQRVINIYFDRGKSHKLVNE